MDMGVAPAIAVEPAEQPGGSGRDLARRCRDGRGYPSVGVDWRGEQDPISLRTSTKVVRHGCLLVEAEAAFFEGHEPAAADDEVVQAAGYPAACRPAPWRG